MSSRRLNQSSTREIQEAMREEVSRLLPRKPTNIKLQALEFFSGGRRYAPSPLQVVAVGGVVQSGPLVLATRQEARIIDTTDELLLRDDESNADSAMLSESDLNALTNGLVIQEVAATENQEIFDSQDPMEFEEVAEEDEFTKEPSPPLEQDVIHAGANQTPSLETSNIGSAVASQPVMMTPELFNSLHLLPELVTSVHQLRSELTNVSSLNLSSFVLRQELPQYVTYQNLQNILAKRPPLFGTQEWKELRELFSPLSSVHALHTKFEDQQKLLKDSWNAIRGVGGRIGSNEVTLKEEIAANAKVVKDMEETMKTVKGCAFSIQQYVASKTDDSKRTSTKQAQQSDASNHHMMAAFGKMNDYTRTYHKLQEEKKAKAKALSETQAAVNQVIPCLFCNLTDHQFRRCTTHKDAETRRLVLVGQNRCFICFNEGCDSTEANCPEKRHRLCPACKHLPASERLHNICLCLFPRKDLAAVNPNIPRSSFNYEAQVQQIATQAPKEIEHTQRKRPKKSAYGQSNEAAAKRSRHFSQNSQKFHASPLHQVYHDQSMAPEEMSSYDQAPQNKKPRTKKFGRKMNNAA
ncbi:hypothetical protein CAEBREN_25387 [Caenorhabditis brenneri]|uniref:Uncharacterized protein n=1 Tax=Caenorhabditis brenneri TaxID=135651 RepID=G0P2N2_CAEBE|nr:hypothetical protein CAEBREN_25387 [Caenorhabditis brenneri]